MTTAGASASLFQTLIAEHVMSSNGYPKKYPEEHSERYPKPPVVKWKARAKAFALFAQGKRPRDISPRSVNNIGRKKLYEYYAQWRKLEQAKAGQMDIEQEDAGRNDVKHEESPRAEAARPPEEAPRAERQGESGFVVFELADQAYALDIDTVREIVEVPRLTAVPGTPDFVAGAMSLRGKAVTVADMRQWFGLPARERDAQTRIVIANPGTEEIGLLVDVANEVLRVSADAIEPALSLIVTAESASLSGVIRSNGRLILLLDCARLLAEMRRL